ncbi:hypothetical protein HNQ02_001510 [Flavobacterium sp. 7E]|uniref:AbiH family protein n=1 Tax=Flavobacterium sp. 7E TaxID=2735898 RepID=UPI00156E026D|nr:AbiH family protein [Flavobacterium sp. 7E]NRS88592.1 hypothetical protein [Flavobacterium sp. 7E]
MNRLVIIGNGFDLAHGLPTSYGNFIDDYWKMVSENLYSNYKYEDHLFTCNIQSLTSKFKSGSLVKNDIKDLFSIENICSEYREHCNLKFENVFFSDLNNTIKIEKWVDVENVYYMQLKKIVKKYISDSLKITEIRLKESRIKVEKLNNDFDQVKDLLEKYLMDKVVDKYDLDFIKSQNSNNLHNILQPISLFSNEQNLFKEFINAEDIKEIKEHFVEEEKKELANNLYFLNFNYTSLSSIYSEFFDKNDRVNSAVNFIHGGLGDILDNKINFGFGDEMDEDYKLIENLDDNEYLKNFKSFKYLQNSNYKNLLDYIDSAKYQVLIMGHSCGLSDRTLLNTIFEHNNCRSIKPFYYQFKNDKDVVIGDNYTEIIQNISRHFNKKKLMREKIVNKTLCKPLPQIKLRLK